jgi:hypothetical protein
MARASRLVAELQTISVNAEKISVGVKADFSLPKRHPAIN